MNQYLNKVINSDCLEIIKQLPDKSIDLILTDPPYGIMIPGKHTGFLNRDNTRKSAAAWDKKPEKEYFDEMFRISKNQVIFGLQYFLDYLPSTKEIIIWDKLTGTSYFADGEAAWTSFKGTLRIYREQWCGCFRENRKEIIHHGTQKPINLFRWIINKYSKKENDIILDPFAGSGTTAHACILENRPNWILIEKEKKYCDIIEERIKQVNILKDSELI